jgi:hypothetical protein
MRVVIWLCAFFFSISAWAKIDDSVDIFFPKELKYLQYSQTEFPVFWWNFVVVDPAGGHADFEKAQQVCDSLKKFDGHEIKRLICGDEIGHFTSTLQDWAGDIVLRESFAKPEKIKSTIEGALAEMSFLSSDKKDFFALKRADPLDQWQIYLEKSQSMGAQDFKREQGFLLDPKSQRLVIPIQFSVAPKMSNVEGVMSALNSFSGVYLVGAHSSAYSNEKQVHQDMDIVAWIGVAVLLLFVAFLVFKGRVGALLLLPPVTVAMLLAMGLVQIIYGSIHGLTLAFGSGIVGLAIDYGLHGAFNSKSSQTWKSNTVGFLTTFAGLIVLVFSGIPLIRQMMVFAIAGIFFGFVIFYLVCKFFPKYFSLQSIEIPFPQFKGATVIVAGLILCGLVGAVTVQPSFDLRKFNFQSTGTAEATNWFFSQGQHQETFLVLHDKEDLYRKTDFEQQWSQEQKIQYAGLGEFLPSPEKQLTNARSWNEQACPYLKKNLSNVAVKVFAPFVENICLPRTQALSFEDLAKKDYLSHLIGKDKFISLFMAKDVPQEQLVKKQFPEAHSLVESIMGFTRSLEVDLHWMIPTALIIALIVLVIYYRNPVYVLAACVPFLTGLGLFFVANFFLHGSLDLISVLGLLMVFGFSVDYGVFVTDLYAFPQAQANSKIVFSVLSLAAFTNITGFFPMVFAKHPILHQLGVALFFGTIGTYLGTAWGVEKLLQFYQRKKS